MKQHDMHHKNEEKEPKYKMLPLTSVTVVAIYFFALHPHPTPLNSLQD
jgi:hypothetical protein